MTSLVLVSTKFGTTRGTMKIGNKLSIFKRGLSVAGNRDAISTDANPRSVNFSKKIVIASPLSHRCYGVSSVWKTSAKANVDGNNVLSSSFPDVDGFHGIYFHDMVWRGLDKWSDKTAVVCSATGRQYTYGQLRKMTGRLATSLRKNNLRPGDTIAAVLPNLPEFAALLLAASEAGIRFTLMNPAFTANEIRTQISNSKASAVFTVPSKHDLVAASISGNSNIRLPIVVIDDGNGVAPSGTIKFEDLVTDDVEEFEKTGQKTGVDTEDTFLMPFSSGTSGLPKGVELAHRNMVANMKQLLVKGVTLASEATSSYQDVVPLIVPMYHIYGLAVCLSLHLCQGAKVVTMPQFTPENLFKLMNDHRSTMIYVAPPLVQMLANDDRFQKRHVESVKSVVCGAAPVAADVLARFKKRLPEGTQFFQGYGLTETSPCISMSVGSPPESTGRLLPNTRIRIVGWEDENAGKNLGFDEVGEIHVSGPQVMKGYYGNERATADCMDGEWFKTGDLGTYDENGFMYIRGRLKELIKVQGFQVAPAEIEHLILTHDKVADAAVIGVDHEKYGEVPKAFVVPKNGAKIRQSEIMDYVAERVSKHKQLGDVEFIDKIPKSAAGKILRRELKKL